MTEDKTLVERIHEFFSPRMNRALFIETGSARCYFVGLVSSVITGSIYLGATGAVISLITGNRDYCDAGIVAGGLLGLSKDIGSKSFLCDLRQNSQAMYKCYLKEVYGITSGEQEEELDEIEE